MAASASLNELTHKKEVSAVASANARFSGKIFPLLVKANGEERNLICSPFSLGSVLALLHAGAAGDTKGELTKGLSLPEEDKVVLEGFKVRSP